MRSKAEPWTENRHCATVGALVCHPYPRKCRARPDLASSISWTRDDGFRIKSGMTEMRRDCCWSSARPCATVGAPVCHPYPRKCHARPDLASSISRQVKDGFRIKSGMTEMRPDCCWSSARPCATVGAPVCHPYPRKCHARLDLASSISRQDKDGFQIKSGMTEMRRIGL